MRETNQPDREVYSCAWRFASSAAKDISASLFSLIERALTPEQLDKAASALSRALSEGIIGDTEAQRLYERIADRRPKRTNGPTRFTQPLGKHTHRAVSGFEPRKRSKSPDREASKARRRKFGGCGALPDSLRQFYSEGERAVLAIISIECRANEACILSVNEIGARAGAGHTLVQNTLRKAHRNGHLRVQERPRPGQKHLTNRVTINAPAWRAWNKKYSAKQGGSGSTFATEVGPTKNTYLKTAGSSKRSDAEKEHPRQGASKIEDPPLPPDGPERHQGAFLSNPSPATQRAKRCAISAAWIGGLHQDGAV